jgi:hypothetical protein
MGLQWDEITPFVLFVYLQRSQLQQLRAIAEEM